MKARCSRASWIFPRYLRLAMGGSHSVHLLMTVNLSRVGRILWNARKYLRAAFDDDDVMATLS